MMTLATPTPSPLAALTIRSVSEALHHGGPSLEKTVKQALRHGAREQIVTSAEHRAVLSSVIFGTAIQRARLSWMMRQLTSHSLHATYYDLSDRREAAAALLVALYLLHETPQRVEQEAVARLLPPLTLGLPSSTVSRLRELDIEAMRWPSSPTVHLATRYSLPNSLARTLIRRLGAEEASSLAQAFNTPGRVTLRANVHARPSGARASLMDALNSAGVACRAGELSPWAVQLDATVRSAYGGSVWSLEGWKEGAFEVQDEGSQLIALACEAQKGESVLDLCAGNGGKALALAALIGSSGRLVAHDVVESRLAALRASAKRAGVDAIVHTFATDPAAAGGIKGAEAALASVSESITAGEYYDVVLVDAPCSSSGTLRRHPGLRWDRDSAWNVGRHQHHHEEEEGETADYSSYQHHHEKEEDETADYSSYQSLQLRLLRQAARLVRPGGGRLVYATCSIDERENELVAEAAFQYAEVLDEVDEDDSRGQHVSSRSLVPWPFAEEAPGRHDESHHMCTLWPHRLGTDGFFVARWRRS